MSLSPYRSRIKALALISLFIVAIALAAQGQTPAPQETTPQTPELASASKIAAQVVELCKQGQYDAALPLARRVVEIREHALGADHPQVGSAVQNLAAVLLVKKNYGEAESLYKRALKIFEKAYGQDSIKLIPALDQLGWLAAAEGNLHKAEEVFLRELTIREKAFGPDNAEVAQSTAMLAQVYEQLGRYDKAADYYKRTIAIKEKTLGPDSNQLVDYLEQCSCALRESHQPEEAVQMHKRATKIFYATNNTDAKPVTGAVLQGSAVYRVEPAYPPEAKQRHIRGSVTVEVTVDESGNVIAARGICGVSILKAAAVEAARKWRFTPTVVNGAAAKVIGSITFQFNVF